MQNLILKTKRQPGERRPLARRLDINVQAPDFHDAPISDGHQTETGWGISANHFTRRRFSS
jgi:hypothetical protein